MYLLECFSFVFTFFSLNQSAGIQQEIKDPGPFYIVAQNFDFDGFGSLDDDAERKMDQWMRRKMAYLEYKRKK